MPSQKINKICCKAIESIILKGKENLKNVESSLYENLLLATTEAMKFIRLSGLSSEKQQLEENDGNDEMEIEEENLIKECDEDSSDTGTDNEEDAL